MLLLLKPIFSFFTSILPSRHLTLSSAQPPTMLTSNFLSAVVPLLMAASPVAAFSCSFHSFTTCQDGIVHWFDPDDGMICDPLDCGGGRAPPKTVPGCPAYKGTLTIATSASYLSCFKKAAATTLPVSNLPTLTAAATSSSPNAPGSSSGAVSPKPVETSKSPATASGAASAASGSQSTAATDAPATTAAPTTSSNAASKSTSAPKAVSTGAAGQAAVGFFAVAAAAVVALL